MAAGAFARLWEFRVVPARLAEFERHYGPDGTWARLFRQSPGYLGTELLNDRADPHRYITIDRWENSGHWNAFHSRFAEEYEALDRHCEGLTTLEASLGEYTALPTG